MNVFFQCATYKKISQCQPAFEANCLQEIIFLSFQFTVNTIHLCILLYYKIILIHILHTGYIHGYTYIFEFQTSKYMVYAILQTYYYLFYIYFNVFLDIFQMHFFQQEKKEKEEVGEEEKSFNEQFFLSGKQKISAIRFRSVSVCNLSQIVYLDQLGMKLQFY